jgi:hypothetical protein
VGWAAACPSRRRKSLQSRQCDLNFINQSVDLSEAMATEASFTHHYNRLRHQTPFSNRFILPRSANFNLRAQIYRL